jgi:hypothetical protein
MLVIYKELLVIYKELLPLTFLTSVILFLSTSVYIIGKTENDGGNEPKQGTL